MKFTTISRLPRVRDLMEHSILSFMVDWKWYARRHGLDMQEAAAWTHFSEVGLKLNLDPNPLFNSQWYSDQYPESQNIGPFQHFISSPVSQRLNPSPLFNSEWYLANNPDVDDADLNPFVHFMRWGRYEGRYPNHWCDPIFEGPLSFNPTLYPNFLPEDLIGYIPHYTTMDRLVTGAEASAFYSPKTPFWVFSQVKPLQLDDLAGRQINVVGGQCEIFCDNIAYTPRKKSEADKHIRAFQVRYAVSPAIRNAISALGQPFHTSKDFERFEYQVACLLQQNNISSKSIDILINAEAYTQMIAYLKDSVLSGCRIIGLENRYICRVEKLLYVAFNEENDVGYHVESSPNKLAIFDRWKQRFFRTNTADRP